MALPIDPKQGFLRSPVPYVHDQFGHDGAVDGCTRVRPHSGIDATPRVANASALAVRGGAVVETGWTIYAGNYVVIQASDGLLWLYIHLARASVRADDVLEAGDELGIIGNTGGGGSGPLAGKTGNLAIHLHVSLCLTMLAVGAIINGLVRSRRKGETAEQWAQAHGLIDPWPFIVDDSKTAANAEEEDDMYTQTDRERDIAIKRDTGATLNALGDVAKRVWTIDQNVSKILDRADQILALSKDNKGIGQILRWALVDDANSARKVLATIAESLAELQAAGPIDTTGMSDEELREQARRIVAELGETIVAGAEKAEA